jgi:lysyl-tRNA synthetase class 2
MHHLSEQEQLRRQKLTQLQELGVEPYPSELFDVNFHAQEILDNYRPELNNFQEVTLAGRLMSSRVMGKASFAELMDSSGRIQLYVNRDEICPGEDKTLYNTVFKKLLDLGDFIGVKGHVFTTQVGEISVHVTELKLLAKSLRPLPVVKTKKDEVTGEEVIYDSFTDPEQRYRQRYVDLVVNPHVRETFIKRTQLVQTMRNYLNDKGYLEVETPILQPLYGGAAAAR